MPEGIPFCVYGDIVGLFEEVLDREGWVSGHCWRAREGCGVATGNLLVREKRNDRIGLIIGVENHRADGKSNTPDPKVNHR